jgi:hypothetical protein
MVDTSLFVRRPTKSSTSSKAKAGDKRQKEGGHTALFFVPLRGG